MSDEKDCRNDCAIPLRFPRRPGTHIFVGNGEKCFCCDEKNRTSADNRPALPHFNYRLGSYGSIREFLLHGINNAPNLQNWTHREADDPAIALLEGAAILGDILTFYQETYANEAFLRTAKWRESIADLVRLLGYRLSPALGGNATFAFELKKDEAVTIPAGFPVKATLEEIEQPAEFETTEEITAYPWLSRFNLFRPLRTPAIVAETNEFYISAPNPAVEIKAGDRLLIGDENPAQTELPIKLDNAEIVIVDSIRTLHDIKLIKIKGGLQKRTVNVSVSQMKAFKLARTFHHFGFNGPRSFTRTTSAGDTVNFEEILVDFLRLLKTITGNPSRNTWLEGILTHTGLMQSNVQAQTNSGFRQNQQNFVALQRNVRSDVQADVLEERILVRNPSPERIVSPSLGADEFPLDAEVQDLASGVPFVVQIDSGDLTFVSRIKKVRSDSMTWGQMTGSASILTLESLQNLLGDKTSADIRQMLFHEVVGEASLTLKASFADNSPVPLRQVLAFYGTAEQAETLRGRRLMFEQAGEEAKIVSVRNLTTPFADLPQTHYIEISEQIDYDDFPQENPLVTVYGNLADADEGKLQPEAALGNGDNTTIFQTFKLPKPPLTYHLNTANTPPETPELEIYVGGRKWQKVENFFGRGVNEEIYIVREDAENNSWVQFGDGKTGARLPTGVKNVSAIYRIGAGAFGALKADTKVQASAKLKNLDKIQMPQIASGGTEAESGENARQAAPGKIQSLDRLVSLRDFETETGAMPGVALVSAAWSLVENIPSVVITVLMETGRGGEISAIEETLSGYNSGRGAARFPIVIPLDENGRSGKHLYVYISAEYALDAKFRADLVEPEIRRVLGVNFGKATNKEDQTGLFSLRNRSFGKREYASTIEGKIQSIEGVIWARVTGFWDLGASDKPDEIPLITKVSGEFVGCDSLHVLSLFDAHLFLTQAGQP